MHIRGALKSCGYPNWTFVIISKRSRAARRRRTNMTTSSFFMPQEYLSWTKDKTSRHKHNNVVHDVQCSQDCTDLYIEETKQPLHKRRAPHRRANSSGQDSAVHLHLTEQNHSFWGRRCEHLGQRRQMVWKTIFEQRRWPVTLLITHIQCSNDFPPQDSLIHSHLGSPCHNNPHKSKLSPQPTSGPDYSETQSSQASFTTL